MKEINLPKEIKDYLDIQLSNLFNDTNKNKIEPYLNSLLKSQKSEVNKIFENIVTFNEYSHSYISSKSEQYKYIANEVEKNIKLNNHHNLEELCLTLGKFKEDVDSSVKKMKETYVEIALHKKEISTQSNLVKSVALENMKNIRSAIHSRYLHVLKSL